ncbi:hypothetical protein [Salinicoccus albus]|uniref:hypothetical protein n=1 Tax=Salinicoccus albus TaxID=418756 RepID=UPI000362A366|nr:hypothetical protein [Salinicoccus albus]
MINLLKNYNYSRQFILVEDEGKKIREKLKSDLELIDIDDYLWTIVTTVSMQNIEGVEYHLIQHEDKQLGWIELEDSIQIFRFPAEHYKVIEEKFTNNEVNANLNIEKDFISHFKGKLLNVKSQIFYKGERYFSVFIKGKFHGFHHHSLLDRMKPYEIEIGQDQLEENTPLYKLSSLTKPVEGELDIASLKLLSVFEQLGVGKVCVNDSDNYWISLGNINGLDLNLESDDEKSLEKLHLDDLFHSVNLERSKSKDIVKTVLSAQEFLNDKKNKNKDFDAQKLRSSFLNDKSNNEDLQNEKEALKKENLELKNINRKKDKGLKLAEQRLDQQKDYTQRLEAQRDKYKDRMQVVEEKLKNLDGKYKALKEKLNSK